MKYDVIVIGGGLAGLVATEDLAKKGYRVCLIEARAQLGGPLAATPSFANISFPLPVYVQGRGGLENPNPLRILLDRLDIATTAIDSFNVDAYDHRGQACSMQHIITELQPQIERLAAQIQTAKRKFITHPKSPDMPIPSLASILNQVLTDHHSPPDQIIWLKKLMNAMVEQELGAEPNTVSLLNLLNNQRFEGQPGLLLEGYLHLVNYYQTQILSHAHAELRLSSQVISINNQKSNLEVTLAQQSEILTAQVVILAVPLAVLKQGTIQFLPPLSLKIQNMLQHFNPGFRNPVLLEFEKPFWPESVHYLFPNDPDAPISFPRYLNLFHFLSAYTDQPKPILMAELYGKTANFKTLSEKQILENCLRPLKNCYSLKNVKLLNYYISHWDQEIHTLGGGAYFNTQAVFSDLETIREPKLPGIYFAHKECSQDNANTLEGEYDSGTRATLEAAAYFENSIEIKKSPKLRH